MAMNIPPVAVIMGGKSREHEVSVSSGKNVAASLRDAGCSTVVEVVIQTNGRWIIQGMGQYSACEAIKILKDSGIECLFPALHGKGGEDGTVQGFLETMGIPYVGSSVLASAIGMSKAATRAILSQAGLPIPKGMTFWNGERQYIVENIKRNIGFPCVLKEDDSGSSLGVFLLENQGDLEELLQAGDPGFPFVVEEFIEGLELTVPVLDLDNPAPLPPVEIFPIKRPFFDYQAKYDPRFSEEICPPKSIGKHETGRIQEIAVKVHEVLGCKDISRTDFIYSGGKPHVLEVNTIPGMTSGSLLPKSARAAGLDFGELLGMLVMKNVREAETR